MTETPRSAPVGTAGQTPVLPRKIFVTGANGFIGRALLSFYRGLGVEIGGVDVQADAEWNVVAGDIGSAGPWQQHAAGCELVINTAAVVSNVAPPELYRRITVGGVRQVIDAAVAAGARRVVQISSCGAYGWHHPADANEMCPITTLSGNRYQDAKAASEHPALAAHAAGEISCTIIRPGDVYGPGSRPWVLIPLDLIRRGQFLLPAHGKGQFSPIYIDDLVDGIALAAGLEVGAGQIFNLTGGTCVSSADFFTHHMRWAGKSGPPRSYSTQTAIAIAETVRLVSKLLGKPTEASRQSMLMLSKAESFSIEKARRLLGYEPKIPLAEGMRRTEEWLRATGIPPSTKETKP